MHPQLFKTCWNRIGRMISAVCACLMLICNMGYAQSTGEVLQHAFEDQTPIGQPLGKELTNRLVAHEITTEDRHTGKKCERFIFQSPVVSTNEHRIVIPLPKARVFKELYAALWVRSNCASVRLGLRVRFPHQLDPRTNAPLEMDLLGPTYTEFSKWQRLTCATTEEVLQNHLIRVRSQLSDGINPVRIDDREAYVDQMTVQFLLPQGQSAMEFDDLEFGPVVRPETVIPDQLTTNTSPQSKLTIVDDRIRKNGEPFFPIFTLYHGENLELMARTGVNMLWIRNYDDRPLLSALESMDIGAIAYPPQPAPVDAILNQSAIPTMPDWTSPIWAWMLGINIPASDRDYITSWAEQVRDADRRIHRPIIADVAAEERDFHRNVDLLSISRCAIHTSRSSLDHFEELRGRRAFALPGKQLITFLQTEASGPLLDYLGERNSIPIVEPEQILHQGFEAIAAGFKGVGFWKQIPLDTDVVGLNERIDAIRIFSIHGRLLEPFIATGRIVDEIPVQVEHRRTSSQPALTSPLASRWDRPIDAKGKVKASIGESKEIRATVFHTDRGLLILLVWHEPGAQCVPGPQTASSVRVLVRGIGDVAQAWEVTPTGVGQMNLGMERVSGGTELTVKEFDQYAAIIVTSTAEDGEAIRALARQSRQMAAETYVHLAESKLARVRDVHQELVSLGTPPVLNAAVLLQKAQEFVEQAQRELSSQRMDEARIASQKALQQLRILQRGHWELAIAAMGSPTASLEASNFQTLPDHWRMITQLGKMTQSGENRLPSGSFEDENALSGADAGGQNRVWTADGAASRFSALQLVKGSDSRNSHLSMIVKPDAPPGQKAVVVSPEVNVSAGEIAVITGQVYLPHPLKGADHQFEIFDTLAGRGGAISFKEKMDLWTPFRIIRKAPKSGTFRVRFELEGPGIANVDDIQVHILHPPTILPAKG